MWHLASDESSYVFLRESEEEQITVAFNNSDKARELRIPLNGTPSEKMAGISLLFGTAKAELSGREVHLILPAQSLSIFSLN